MPVHIDIGGGVNALYFSRLAPLAPKEQFVVLEPSFSNTATLPPNVRRIRWKSDRNSSLPFASGSIDAAHLNFLYAQIQYSEEETGPKNRELGLRRLSKLFEECREVLKPRGKIHIVDHELIIQDICTQLLELGYEIVQEPRAIRDIDRTETSAASPLYEAITGLKLYPFEVTAVTV